MLSDDQLGAVHLLLDRIRARQLQDFGQIGSDVKPDGSLITDCDRWSDSCLLYTSPSPRDLSTSRMPSSA